MSIVYRSPVISQWNLVAPKTFCTLLNFPEFLLSINKKEEIRFTQYTTPQTIAKVPLVPAFTWPRKVVGQIRRDSVEYSLVRSSTCVCFERFVLFSFFFFPFIILRRLASTRVQRRARNSFGEAAAFHLPDSCPTFLRPWRSELHTEDRIIISGSITSRASIRVI